MARSPIRVVLLTVLTLGAYGVYWFYTASKTVVAAGGLDRHPAVWTIGLFIPVVDIIVLWRFASSVAATTHWDRPATLFAAWVLFFPAGQYLTQQALNRAAGDPQRAVPP